VKFSNEDFIITAPTILMGIIRAFLNTNGLLCKPISCEVTQVLGLIYPNM